MSHPRALLFDVFGTVVDWRSSVAREIERIAEQKGCAVNGHDVATAWRKRYQPAMAKIREGNRGFVPLDILHMENLRDVLAEAKSPPAALLNANGKLFGPNTQTGPIAA